MALVSPTKNLHRQLDNLTQENINQATEIANLKAYIQTLELERIELELDHLFRKYVIAIQDFNRLEKLETKVPALSEMRFFRVSECHFITDDDSPDDILNKRNVLTNKLLNIRYLAVYIL